MWDSGFFNPENLEDIMDHIPTGWHEESSPSSSSSSYNSPPPMMVDSPHGDVTLTALHKPRGSKGVWVPVSEDECLRVTRSHDTNELVKRLRLELRSQRPIEPDTIEVMLVMASNAEVMYPGGFHVLKRGELLDDACPGVFIEGALRQLTRGRSVRLRVDVLLRGAGGASCVTTSFCTQNRGRKGERAERGDRAALGAAPQLSAAMPIPVPGGAQLPPGNDTPPQSPPGAMAVSPTLSSPPQPTTASYSSSVASSSPLSTSPPPSSAPPLSELFFPPGPLWSNTFATPLHKRQRENEEWCEDDEEDPVYRVDGSLNVHGTLRAQAIVQLSDERYKTSVRDVVDALSQVMQLRGKTYLWRLGGEGEGEDEGEDDDDDDEEGEEDPDEVPRRVFGLLAQEVERVLPELVYTDKVTGIKGVAYTELIPLLLEALKEHVAEFREHRNEMQRQMAEVQKAIEDIKVMCPQLQSPPGGPSPLQSPPLSPQQSRAPPPSPQNQPQPPTCVVFPPSSPPQALHAVSRRAGGMRAALSPMSWRSKKMAGRPGSLPRRGEKALRRLQELARFVFREMQAADEASLLAVALFFSPAGGGTEALAARLRVYAAEECACGACADADGCDAKGECACGGCAELVCGDVVPLGGGATLMRVVAVPPALAGRALCVEVVPDRPDAENPKLSWEELERCEATVAAFDFASKKSLPIVAGAALVDGCRYEGHVWHVGVVQPGAKQLPLRWAPLQNALIDHDLLPLQTVTSQGVSVMLEASFGGAFLCARSDGFLCLRAKDSPNWIDADSRWLLQLEHAAAGRPLLLRSAHGGLIASNADGKTFSVTKVVKQPATLPDAFHFRWTVMAKPELSLQLRSAASQHFFVPTKNHSVKAAKVSKKTESWKKLDSWILHLIYL